MDASMMKAITYSEFGMSTDVLKLRELPIPKADKGEVLVSLEFSGSNPSDAKSRAGNRPGITKPQFEQIVPNSAGTVQNARKSHEKLRFFVFSGAHKNNPQLGLVDAS